jgi:hypothetical protein
LKSKKASRGFVGAQGYQERSNLEEGSSQLQNISTSPFTQIAKVIPFSAVGERIDKEDQAESFALQNQDEEPKELSDTIDPNLITLWLQYCEQRHGVECSRRELEPDFSAEMDIIVIDTRQKCLARVTTAARHFALSYVWGPVCRFSINLLLLIESLWSLAPDCFD